MADYLCYQLTEMVSKKETTVSLSALLQLFIVVNTLIYKIIRLTYFDFLCFQIANVEGNVLIQGSRLRLNDTTYFHVNNVLIDLDVGHVSIHFNNLFNGDRELGKLIKGNF